MFEHVNEPGLIEKPVAREEEGFELLFTAAKPHSTRLFTRLKVCDPEELVGRVLLKLVQYDYLKFDPERGCLSAFVATIAWRVFCDWTRESEGRSEVQLGLCLDLLVSTPIQQEPKFIPKPEVEVLINELPELDRWLVYRRGADRVNFDQLADEFSLSEGAVRRRFYRSRKKLRHAYKGLNERALTL
jgi:RNA polymerase sigma factor (sigma-70 family)